MSSSPIFISPLLPHNVLEAAAAKASQNTVILDGNYTIYLPHILLLIIVSLTRRVQETKATIKLLQTATVIEGSRASFSITHLVLRLQPNLKGEKTN